MFVRNTLLIGLTKEYLKVLGSASDISETELKEDVTVVLHEVLDREEDGVQGIGNHVLSQEAGSRDGHGVAVDHPETLLEDGFLTTCRGYFLLAGVPGQMDPQAFFNHEAGSINLLKRGGAYLTL